jgi:hypothetical protein
MKSIKYMMMFLASLFTISSYGYWAYHDKDKDGHYCCTTIKSIPAEKVMKYLNDGYIVSLEKPLPDCDDNNPLVWNRVKLYKDADGDKYIDDWEDMKIECWNNSSWPDPTYIRLEDALGRKDCDPTDNTKWRFVGLKVDADGDKYVVGPRVRMCIGTNPPEGYIFDYEGLGMDCDDSDPTVWRSNTYFYYIKECHPTHKKICYGNTPPDPAIYSLTPLPDCEELGLKSGTPVGYNVYPNPASDKINIIATENWKERAELKLVDPFGRVVKTLNVPSLIKDQTVSMVTADLKPGIYRLTVKRGELIESKAIAVKL